MFERLQKLLDRVESRIALWTVIQGSSILTGGVLTGWLAWAEAWVSAYGRLGWWLAALTGALLTSLVLLGFAGIRYLWVRASALNEWSKRTDTVNPLGTEFHKSRIRFADLANPFSRTIERKRFVDCDLMGEADLLLLSNCTFFQVRFSNCQVVVIQDVSVGNVIGLDHVEINGGTVWNCTLFIPPSLVRRYYEIGAPIITLTGDPEIDSQLREGIARKTSPKSHPD